MSSAAVVTGALKANNNTIRLVDLFYDSFLKDLLRERPINNIPLADILLSNNSEILKTTGSFGFYTLRCLHYWLLLP